MMLNLKRNVEIFEKRLLVYKKNYTADFMSEFILKNNLSGIRVFEPFIDNFDFKIFENVKGLKELSFSCANPIDFDFLYRLNELEILSVQTIFSILDFQKIPNLKIVSLNYNNKYVKNIDSLKLITSLFVSNVNDLEWISKLISLKSLSIKGCNCRNIESLHYLYNLKHLLLGDFTILEKLNFSEKDLQKLTYLELNSCSNLKNVDSVSKLKKLEFFEIIDCKKLKINISSISNLKMLKQISILGNVEVPDNINCLDKIENIFTKKYTKNKLERKSFFNLCDKHLETGSL